MRSSILVPDGIGIVWAMNLLYGIQMDRIAGFDVFRHVMIEANASNSTVFFLGSSEDTLLRIKEKVNKDYPNILVDYFSPPFRKEFNNVDSKAMINAVNKFSPRVLFVGMTAPKQEKWVLNNIRSLNTCVICNIGAVFDFYSGNVKRPNKFWCDLGLEWLVRFLKEPRRLFRRNFHSTPLFIIIIIRAKVLMFLKAHLNK
jgi:N-acetylglucosaminyldiphosphoundecaprenol N-acetyl-beta-D-mannosaminyltransferase